MLGLRRMGGWLLLRRLVREVEGIRQEQVLMRLALESIAGALQRAFPVEASVQPSTGPAVEITYVSEEGQAEWMEIELGLTRATGRPPTEEEVLVEYERRHPELSREA